jgi:hypothetical protein
MSQKNIVVVVDKDIRKYGRQLVHSISKSNIAKASLYSPKQYEDNEHQNTGNQMVIFLGKNDVSKDYIPMIEKTHEEHGIVWGFDASKAIIFIDKNVSVNKKDLYNSIAADSVPVKGELIIGIDIGIGGNIERKILAELQYAFGIASFVKDGFEDFIKD